MEELKIEDLPGFVSFSLILIEFLHLHGISIRVDFDCEKIERESKNQSHLFDMT